MSDRTPPIPAEAVELLSKMAEPPMSPRSRREHAQTLWQLAWWQRETSDRSFAEPMRSLVRLAKEYRNTQEQ